ncbi:oxidative stress defense protein [Candidatus Fukatsuia symbiotica]|uniref:Oxidative stress defense protein n=1 Tax=Candidatus Fukatsuia symbiotica TaxID=1878942 RepID=A0A2U8I5L3_9GAMM|nr:oxidative stress defense protein [Candidatus Fukatsuia symbiotica]AWK14418.1 oxidative stress defense protein [Candidatus Fukatsuia symbiotica]MEA9444696.1 oxidative stress defense protein [Candidatus Fukatsuia symbiotica]
MKLKALALATMIGLGTSAPKAAEVPAGPHIVTSGNARLDVIPDIAILTIEVSELTNDAAAAKKQVDQRVAQYFDFLQKQGLEKKDISAANLRTQEEYDYKKTGDAVLKGYRAVRQVRVTLRQLDKLNDLLDGALKLGLNEIRAVELDVANSESYREKVRKQAIENAIAVAGSVAKDFKSTLGPVYSIRYRTANYQPMPMMARMQRSADIAAQSDVTETYKQQSIRFDDQVDVVFELQR